jgi:hypothetical protein
MAVAVRPDLIAAHQAAWRALGEPGSFFTGAQRVELARTALAALTVAEPLAPWLAPSTVVGLLDELAGTQRRLAPEAAHDTAYRLARHAGTLTEGWYERTVAAIEPLAYVELVALVCAVAAVESFRRSAGLPQWPLPAPAPGEPTGFVAAQLSAAALNWVPVAAPADERAAVVQAFSALPVDNGRIWAMADAQYIPDLEMVDPRWTRGTLTRPQMELVATRVAQIRECFF